MPTTRFVRIALAAGLLLPAVASAETLKGRVTTVNPQDKSFQVTGTNRETMRIDVVRVVSDKPVDSLKIGDKITVEGSRGPDGALKATSVSSESSAAEPGAPAMGAAGHALRPSGSTGGEPAAQTVAAQQGNPKLE